MFQGTRGGVLRNGNFNRRTFAPAAIAIGEPALTPHGLRHTAASLAIAAGGNVKVVQQMLGHATASMKLDLYGHLFPDQLDDVADRLDVIGRAAADISADYLRTRGAIDPLQPKNQRPQQAPDLRLCTWARPGSNRRQPRCKRGALPTELQAPKRSDAVDRSSLRPPTRTVP